MRGLVRLLGISLASVAYDFIVLLNIVIKIIVQKCLFDQWFVNANVNESQHLVILVERE